MPENLWPTTYTYPDVSIVCGDIQFVENRDDTVINPVVIIEVLSRSTSADDRWIKFRAYRMMPSLQDYIMVTVEFFSNHSDLNKSYYMNGF